MKHVIAAAALGITVGAGVTASAQRFPRHPNLEAAYTELEEVTQKLNAAQQQNEFDVGGHAANAKGLVAQAIAQLERASGAANDDAKKK